MMSTRELTHPPQILPLYLRAAATLVPGAGRLPGLPGGGGEIPDVVLVLRDAAIDEQRLAEYRSVCCFAAGATIPATFLHLPAFPLHMALMSEGGFPFGAVGLVHIENEITQLRPVESSERVDLTVHAGPLEPHPRGRIFSIFSEARIDGEPVWRERSTMLRRGGSRPASPRSEARGGASGPADGAHASTSGGAAASSPAPPVTWQVPEDIGRRYGSVSGDRNPIHLHALTARAFGFPRAIAHGMWSKARCLAAIQAELPDSFTVSVDFRKPVLLPASVSFAAVPDGPSIDFSLRAADADVVHLTGRVSEPVGNTGQEVAAGQVSGPGTGSSKRAGTR